MHKLMQPKHAALLLGLIAKSYIGTVPPEQLDAYVYYHPQKVYELFLWNKP